ncbi:MAG: hypothetical protein ABJZ55_10315 [Fuerstiella sp.]
MKTKQYVTLALGIAVLTCVSIAAYITWAQSPSAQTAFENSAGKPNQPGTVGKPRITDTVRANVYADNWFILYINGELVAVDSIKFMPHNVVSVDILPTYPMTIAVMAKDNADAKTGMEYANSSIGDGGFIFKLGDGTVTNAQWKAQAYSQGPIDGNTTTPQVVNTPIPENWYAINFDDQSWNQAKEYTQAEIGPKEPFFETDFEGARFIWTDDLKLDNTILFRHTVRQAPDGKVRPDFSNLNNTIPNGRPNGRPKRPRS